MKIFVLLICFVIASNLKAQEITSYNLDVNINVKQKSLHVEGNIGIDFQKKDSINFVLWKNSVINEIRDDIGPVKFHFDTLSPSPIIWVGKGSGLTIIKTPGSSDKQILQFNYDCDFKDSNNMGWAWSFSDDWIELNCYCAWYPAHFESTNYTSKFLIHIDDGFLVTGSGIVAKKDKYWEMLQPWASFDNVIIASKNLRSKVLNENNAFIQAEYNAPDFSSTAADSIIRECKYALELFEKFFGKKDSTYLKYVIAPFEYGGGYSRKNFVSMRTKHFNFYSSTKGIAHEIAHFWWNGAKTTIWEDWLNESFAEYSMLIYIRERFGPGEFNKLVAEYKEKTKNLPAIWNIDRNAQEAYSVLYEKGSLILLEFENRIGKEKFLGLLKEFSDNKITTTEDFLNLIEKELSKETRLWFEDKLKS